MAEEVEDPLDTLQEDDETIRKRRLSESEEVDDFIDHSIEVESNKKMRQRHMNAIMLTFKDKSNEEKFHQCRDDMFKSNMACAIIIWAFIVICQFITIPTYWVTLLIHLVTTLILVLAFLLAMAEEMESFPIRIQNFSSLLAQHRTRRNILVCGVIIIIGTATSSTIVVCDKPDNKQCDQDHVFACKNPEYFVYTWILTMVVVAAFLKLNFLVKTLLLMLKLAIYSVFTLTMFNYLFSPPENTSCDRHEETLTHVTNGIPLYRRALLLLGLFFLVVVYHGRLVEVTARLDFLWKMQAQKELQGMQELRQYNTQLLKNILPDHAAKHFLAEDRNNEELYSQSMNCVGVLFASIPNFSDFYSEDVNRGLECIRLLNEIIVDFDQLLDEDRFKCIEKIKTVGSTYMAASGLCPKENAGDDNRFDHMCSLVDFALAMKEALNELNKHSFNNFKLRIGISHGPLVGGVIGAKKPVYDIWGNTVNEASRMDSTGTIDCIQVPAGTAKLLQAHGYTTEYRGVVAVKGKGDMETYYVLRRSRGKSAPPSRQPSLYNSLAAVVYGMLQTRKKQTDGDELGVPAFRQRKVTPASLDNGRLMRMQSETPKSRRPSAQAAKATLSYPNMRQTSSRTHHNGEDMSPSAVISIVPPTTPNGLDGETTPMSKFSVEKLVTTPDLPKVNQDAEELGENKTTTLIAA